MKNKFQIEEFVSKHHKHIILGILCFFALIFCSVSLINHYFFRTSAYDLGIYTNQLYHYLHLDLRNTVIYPNMNNKWADHFSVFQVLFSPLALVFGSSTLLIVQITFILLGGIGCHKIVYKLTQNETLSVLSLCHFYSLWGIYSALSFDYHDNVIGAMIFPWLVYFFMQNQFGKATIALVSILLCKETMGLWMIFVGVFLFFYSENSKQKKFAFFTTGLAIVYFYVVFFKIIPNLNTGFSYKHFKYSHFGTSFSEVIVYFFNHPLDAIKYLFVNHTNDTIYDYIKLEFWYMFLLCGGFAVFKYPRFIIAYLPILLTKMYNDQYGKWGINVHYSIETVPILCIGLFYFIHKLKASIKIPVAISCLAICILLTLIKLNNRKAKWYNKCNAYFAVVEHYQSDTDVRKLHFLINSIEDHEKISASSPIVPRLSYRKHIYTFPYIGEADKIIINTKLGCWPIPENQLQKEIEKLKNSASWQLSFQKGDNYIFERIGINDLNPVENYEFY